MKRILQFLKLYLLFLLLFEFGRLYFILYNPALFTESLLSVFVQTAWKGFRLDLSAAAYCMAPFLLIILGEHLLRKKSPVWLMRSVVLLEVTVVFLVTIADPELYVQWGNKFNNQVLVYISHPREMALSAGSVRWGRTLLFAFLLAALYYPTTKKAFKLTEKAFAYSWQYLLVTVLILVLNFIFLRGGIGVTTISQASAIYSTNQAKNAAAVNSLWNAVYYVVNDTRALYGDEHKFVDEGLAEQLFRMQVQSASDSFSLSDIERPNVLIVMLESFTASASQYFSGSNNCMPGLDRIAKENLSFMQCYSSGDRTEKGLVSVNSGYPAQPVSSVIIFPDKVNKLPGLSKVLKPLGYNNVFVYGGDAEFASMKSYLLMQRFDRVIDKHDFHKSAIKSKWGAHDRELYEKTIEIIDGMQSPFYTLALSLSSHEPFDVPYHSDDLPKDNWYGFKNSLRYADNSLDNFLAVCKGKSWYANTLIILVADHGHDIGLEGNYFFGKEKYHIPMVVTGGALKPSLRGRQIRNIVSQTVIPCMLLQTMHLSTAGFRWQTNVLDRNAFAQYFYNSGFGRIQPHSECVYDNNGSSYLFKGSENEKDSIQVSGRVFQQVLIDDFLKK